MSWRMSLLRGASQATSLITTRLQKPALRYDRTQKQQGACQGMVLSSGGSCQTPICTEGTASCMMQTGVWEVEDEKTLNQRCEWQKLKRWGQAQVSGESILPGELKQSQTSCNMLLSKKKRVYSGAPADFLKINQAAGSSTSNASKYFICKRCSEAFTHSLRKDTFKVGQKTSLSLRRNQVPNK